MAAVWNELWVVQSLSALVPIVEYPELLLVFMIANLPMW